MRRTLRVIAVAWRWLLFPSLPLRRRTAEPAPVRVRKALQDLGGAWVKAGQMLALRFDVLPAAYCYELFRLLNDMEPFPYEDVRRIVTEDLGDEPDKLFATFDRVPFAAASIGQVHRGTLPSGEAVAVKVQRPNIRKDIAADVRLMYRLGAMIDRTPVLGATRVRDIVDEFVRWTKDELDFLVEAGHATALRRNAAGDPFEHDAGVFPEWSSHRVLTMEFLDGIAVIDVLYALRRGDEDYVSKLLADGYDLREVAKHVSWNVLNQIYVHGRFHADLHPANLFILPGNAIGYVDFGITGSLSPRVRDSLAYHTWNLYSGNVEQAVDEIMRWVAPTGHTDVDAARAEFVAIFDGYLADLHAGSRGVTEGGEGFEVKLLDAIRRHHMRASRSIVAYLKAIATVDAVILELDPDFDLVGSITRFFRGKMREDFRDLRDSMGLVDLFDLRYRVDRVLESTVARPVPTGERGRREGGLAGALGLLALGATGVLAYALLAGVGDAVVLGGLLAIIGLTVVGVIAQGRRRPQAAERRRNMAVLGAGQDRGGGRRPAR